MRVTAGELNQRITISREEHVSDGQGGSTTTKKTVLSCWGRVKVLSAKDAVVAMKDVDLRTHEILIRYPDGNHMPAINDLVEWRTSLLRIRATRPGSDDASLFIDCVTEV